MHAALLRLLALMVMTVFLLVSSLVSPFLNLAVYGRVEPGSMVICCPEDNESRIFKLENPHLQDEEIRELQMTLQKLGLYHSEINGIYDKDTEKAIIKFQAAYNLPPDGIFGHKTRLTLSRILENPAAKVKTSASARPKGNVEVVIDLEELKLTVFDDKKIFKEFAVAVGKEETPTPIGDWKIQRKALDWGTGFGTRWLGLNVPWGLYGIHGTNKPWSIGSEASHGCIRMFNHDVEELYNWVKVGTTVRIIGEVFPPFYEKRNKVHKGHNGAVVILIQKGLVAEGYLKAKPDGVFGQMTEEALKRLQKDRGLEVTGQVDVDVWPILGL